jgi:hypothetical protein
MHNAKFDLKFLDNLMQHQKDALKQIEMFNHTNTEITRKYIETMDPLSTKDAYYAINDETGAFDITPKGIRHQAESFWRDCEFYDICCDSDEEDDDCCEFDVVGTIPADETGDSLVIYNSCSNREGPAHNYYITLLQEDDGGHKFYMTAWDPIKFSTQCRYYEGDLATSPNLSPLSATEIQFWGEVAKIYPTIPGWMIERDLADWDKAPWGFDIATDDSDDNDVIDTDGHLQGLTLDPITSWGLIGYKTYTAEQLAEKLAEDLKTCGEFNFFDIPDMDPAWGKGWFPQNQNPCLEIALDQHEMPEQSEPEQQETYNSPFDGETK